MSRRQLFLPCKHGSNRRQIPIGRLRGFELVVAEVLVTGVLAAEMGGFFLGFLGRIFFGLIVVTGFGRWPGGKVYVRELSFQG